MKIEVSIDLLKDFIDNCEAYNLYCNHCKYKGTSCHGKSCSDSIIETLIEKSQLILDFDSAILELKKQKNKCTEKQTPGLLFAIEKLKEIKEEFKQTKEK
jgi:hypothetical protein